VKIVANDATPTAIYPELFLSSPEYAIKTVYSNIAVSADVIPPPIVRRKPVRELSEPIKNLPTVPNATIKQINSSVEISSPLVGNLHFGNGMEVSLN
jgi:hypothetical protein